MLLGFSCERAAIVCFAIFLVVHVFAATSLVAASDSWPLFGLTPSAGSWTSGSKDGSCRRQGGRPPNMTERAIAVAIYEQMIAT